jgi:hypothetical protein
VPQKSFSRIHVNYLTMGLYARFRDLEKSGPNSRNGLIFTIYLCDRISSTDSINTSDRWSSQVGTAPASGHLDPSKSAAILVVLVRLLQSIFLPPDADP